MGKSVYDLYLPDRSQYTEYYCYNTKDIQNSVNSLLNQPTLKKRILVANSDLLKKVSFNLEKQKVKYSIRNTQHFVLDYSHLGNFKSKGDSLDVVNFKKDNDYDILLMFMISSFGVDFNPSVLINPKKRDLIQKNLSLAINDPKNHIYFVKHGNLFVGCFTLVELPNLPVLQLHSVAGRAENLNSYYLGECRFELLSEGVLHAFKNSDSRRLLFSSSKPKVVKKYLDFGFQINSNYSCLEIS